MEDVTRNCNRLVPSGQKGGLGLYLSLRVGRHAVAAKFINSHQLVLSAGRLFLSSRDLGTVFIACRHREEDAGLEFRICSCHGSQGNVSLKMEK